MSVFTAFFDLFGRRAPERSDNTGGDDRGGRVDADGFVIADWITRSACHPGRVGGTIDPWGVVLHTTDMHPSSFGALLRRTARDPGRGSGYHFLVGRSAAEGTHQLVSVRRNANHAGAGRDAEGRPRPHGWIEVAGTRHHPNTVTVGIEVHCAGLLTRIDGRWRTTSGGKATGAPIDDADVEAVSASRGWHRPTEYQLATTSRLLDLLGAVLRRPPFAGPVVRPLVRPNGTPPKWANRRFSMEEAVTLPRSVPTWGHVDLDPARKTDPGPALIALLKRRGW